MRLTNISLFGGSACEDVGNRLAFPGLDVVGGIAAHARNGEALAGLQLRDGNSWGSACCRSESQESVVVESNHD